MSATLYASPDGRYRNDRLEMVSGDASNLTFDLTALARSDTVTGFTITADTLTFTAPNISGDLVTCKVSGGEGGKNYIVTTTITLDSGETKTIAFTIECKAPGFEYRAGWG